MPSIRKIAVYGLAALVGFASAYLLLPRDETIPNRDAASGSAGAPEEESEERAVLDQETVSAVSSVSGEETDSQASKRNPRVESMNEDSVRKENPHARRIREALSTPGHELIATCSPVWVQVKRVLRDQEDEVWLPQVEDILRTLRKGSRDMELDAAFIVEEQKTLLNRLWNSDLGESDGGAVREVLSVLAERLEGFEG